MRTNRRQALVVLEITVPVVLVGAWFLASSGSRSLYFPPLADIMPSLWDDWLGTNLPTDVLPSVKRVTAGYALAVVLGVIGGVLLGLSQAVRGFADPALQFMRALPGPALVPLAIVVLGIGDTMRISTIAFTVIWPILLNAEDGVRSVDHELRATCRVYRVPLQHRLFRVILPAASPQILTGMRVALPLTFAIMVISEMIGATSGVGFTILHAQTQYETTIMWSGIVLIGLAGVVLNALLLLLQRHILSWHPDYRNARSLDHHRRQQPDAVAGASVPADHPRKEQQC